MPTLYEIESDLQALDDLLCEMGGDISDPEVEKAVDAWFAEADSNVTTKVNNYCRLLAEMDARAAVRKAESDRLAALAHIDSNASRHLKSRLLGFMQRRAYGRLDCPDFRVSVAKNGGRLPLEIKDVVEKNPAILDGPDRVNFTQTTIALDKERIRAALEQYEAEVREEARIAEDEGREPVPIPCPVEWAWFGERGQHLRIK
jgi:hypothetical protein